MPKRALLGAALVSLAAWPAAAAARYRVTVTRPRGEGILTYSQATDPTSPWYANMTRLFSAGRFVTLEFSPPPYVMTVALAASRSRPASRACAH